MDVVLFGATGTIGSRIFAELLARGHHIKAVVRDIAKVPVKPNVVSIAGNILDPNSVTEESSGADAVVSAFAPDPKQPEQLVDAAKSLIDGIRKSGVKRLIVISGAGSLEVSPGVQLVDSPNFPVAWKPIALAHRDALEVLRKASDLEWTAISPAALIQPGERTGKFQLGTDQLITDSKGQSRISAEDFAIALADELERPEHIRARFTLAYSG